MAVGVYLVDDHEVVRRGLSALINAENGLEVVGETGEASAALAGIVASGARLVVLEIRLHGSDGVTVCRQIRAHDPGIACLMLTAVDDDEVRIDAFAAGAAGYLLKDASGPTLVDAVGRVAAGGHLLGPTLSDRALVRLPHEEDLRIQHLTPQERRVLHLVAEGLTNRQIGEHLYLSEKTIKNYVSNLLAKLGMRRRTQAAVYYSGLSVAAHQAATRGSGRAQVSASGG